MQEGKKQLKALGVAIRDARLALRVSQEDFGELADLHRTYVGQIERGEKNISFVNLSRVARALSLKPSELLRKAGS
jgi:transcriptional regulator with XRE-family HTH domain